MDELIEQMAARAPAGPACPTCGRETRLVVFGEQWCSRCRLFRPFPDDPRIAAVLASPDVDPQDQPAFETTRSRRTTRAA